MKARISVSIGELIDKITILRIKEEKISDSKKLTNIKIEKAVLESELIELKLKEVGPFLEQLETVNTKLWHIEDDIRDKERVKEFDSEFIELARSVYKVNDERFKIKSKCNEVFGSDLTEEKSYKKYD